MSSAVVIAAFGGLVVGLLVSRLALNRSRQPGDESRVQVPVQSDEARSAAHIVTPPDPDADLARGLRNAVDRLQMGVVLCNSDLDITYRNDAAQSLSGTHVGVIVNHHLGQILEAVQSGAAQRRAVELHGPPKTTYLVEAVSAPDGGVVATIDDISERVRIDSMRTDFVANISHELKTPVGAIAVLAEMLEGEADAATISTLSERIVAESHRAASTIDDLLELSRIESSQRLDDSVLVADLLNEAVARGRMAASGRGIDVEAIASPHDVSIKVDRAQLASAVGNLVENAVKYSNEGGTVQVRSRCNERWLEIMVADHGVGIPQRDLDRVFERFYRVDKARARDTGGTGLGLAIVRHVATNHGGDVSVSSTLGEGSTFVLRLPTRLIVDATPPAPSEVSVDSDTATP